jgi:hypothetical protein
LSAFGGEGNNVWLDDGFVKPWRLVDHHDRLLGVLQNEKNGYQINDKSHEWITP